MGSRRAIAGTGMASREMTGAGMTSPPPNHHVITATRFGLRRRKDSGSQQRQGCRRSATHEFPRHLRDHEGSEPTGIAATDDEYEAAQNRHQLQ
jgi:hypothetical protein